MFLLASITFRMLLCSIVIYFCCDARSILESTERSNTCLSLLRRTIAKSHVDSTGSHDFSNVGAEKNQLRGFSSSSGIAGLLNPQVTDNRVQSIQRQTVLTQRSDEIKSYPIS